VIREGGEGGRVGPGKVKANERVGTEGKEWLWAKSLQCEAERRVTCALFFHTFFFVRRHKRGRSNFLTPSEFDNPHNGGLVSLLSLP